MNETIFKCPHCGQMFDGSKEDIGAEAECPSCGKAFMLEALGSAFDNRPNAFMCFLGIFKRYFGFRGRMGRRDFWWAFFFCWVSYILSAIIDIMIWGDLNWISCGVLLGSLIPLEAAQVRRLHDTDKSGWWILLILLCPINIAYFVWLATDGDKGPNRFGFDPKGR